MQERQLGRSDLRIPTLMFGGNVFGWTASRDESFRLLDQIVAGGLYAIDTADVYSAWVPGHAGGESESIIGDWLSARGNRDKVVIATKVGMAVHGGKGLSRTWITTAIEGSLRRLRTDHVDLYQAHADDPDTPLEETLEAFAALVTAGKVRVIGASNYTAPRLREALAVSDRLGLPRYESLQPHYNLVERSGYEKTLEPLVTETGLGVIPYYSLASGFLTGKYRSEADLAGRARAKGAAAYLNPKGMAVLAALDQVAARTNANVTQVALAWLIARPSITAPIVSASHVDQVGDLIKATALRLDADDIALIDKASAGD